MSEDQLRWLAAIIIVAIGVAYMGWLVITYLGSRETEMSIRQAFNDMAEKWEARPVFVPSESVPDES